MKQLAILLVVAAAIAIGLLATQPLDAFWGPDGANRFIQLQQFLRHGSMVIEYPLPDADPAGVLAPTGGHHFVRRDGGLVSFYSPLLPFFTAPLYPILGLPALFVIPLLGTLATLALLGKNRLLVGLALLLATPLLFYTVVFWEHTLAIALAFAAYRLVIRERLFVAGLVAALGAVVREEGYIAIAAITIALLASRRSPLRFCLGALLPLIPFWIANTLLFGHPLGLHAAVYRDMGSSLLEKITNFHVYLFEGTSNPLAQKLLPIPAIALILLALVPRSPFVDRLRVVLLHVAGIAALVQAWLLLANATPLRETMHAQGLVAVVPLAILPLAFVRELPRMLAVTIVTAIILTCLALNQADVGVIWGPRHFLWLLPLLAIATIECRRRLPRGAVILLLAASIAVQFAGIRLLREKLQFSEQLLDHVRRSDAPVIVTTSTSICPAANRRRVPGIS